MRFITLALLLFVAFNAQAGKLKIECNNSDLDSTESFCGEIALDGKYTQCDFNFTNSVNLTDFDIVFRHRVGKNAADIRSTTEYSVSADYNTPVGYLWKASSDLTTAAAATPVHTLILIRMNNVYGLEFIGSSSSAVIEGWLECSDL